jgi:pimeloyl-ACP methyl ester carboxylesterase
MPLMVRVGPAVAIDLPGWCMSGRPVPARLDYTMYGLSAFLESCLDELGVERRKLVVHDWGSLALIGAQRRPDLVERLVVINAVPLLPGYRWHWVAQIWRRRGLGELANATATKSSLALILRQLSGDRRAMPPRFVERIWRHLDHGTNEATLALYRHADPDRLALAGKDLNRLACPSLVLWGANDPFLQSRFGEAYARALPTSTLQLVPMAGHWPWIDDVRVVDAVRDFLDR